MSDDRLNIARCTWCGTDALMIAYHDAEWGVPLQKDGQIPFHDHDSSPQSGNLRVVHGTTNV
jgi:hypothetical protein